MATLLKCGAIFLHVPKTGGVWVSEVLERLGLVFANVGELHSNLEQVRAFESWFRLAHKYSKPNRPLFKFCFVRHPLRWYESWFKMMTNRDWRRWGDDPGVWHPSAMLDGLGAADFDGFVENVLRKRPGYLTEMYGWYTGRGVHFVGRQECLAEHLILVLRSLNVEFEPEFVREYAAVNASPEMSLQWRPDLRREMERAEYAAYRRFGYGPEGSPSTVPPAASFIEGIVEPIRLRDPFLKESGCAWQVILPELSDFSDSPADPFGSALVVYEEGRPLPIPHSVHEEIRQAGCGRYSHWMGQLLFSTSDNSDPNTNGRRYDARFCHGDQPAV